MSAFEEGIRQIMETTESSFQGRRSLVSYLEDSSFNWQEQLTSAQETLQDLTQKYSRDTLRRARRTAKSLKKASKNGSTYIKRILKDFERLEELKGIGTDETQKIQEIKDIAYQRGVEFLREKAREFEHSDTGKYKKLLDTAEKNEKLLQNHS